MPQHLAFRGSEVLVRDGVGQPVLDCQGLLLPGHEDLVALGDGARFMAFALETEAPRGWVWMPFRALIGTQPEGLWCGAARALSILNWRSSTRFCGSCGSPNGDKPGELARLCPACGTLSFPRISPALLAVVMKEGRLLLARNTQYKTGIWSVLAGFLEPGETLEDCLCREVREEVDIEVQPGAYLGSQPWPYPDQLMVAFAAEWKSGQLRPDGVEIAEADWFGPEDLPPLPLPGSLSRRVIDMAFACHAGR